MSPHHHISGAEQVLETFGCWPDFHDAELISFIASRALSSADSETVARLGVHVRRYTAVGNETADYRQALEKSALVHFVCIGASDFEFSGFNHQNVIDSISVSSVEGEPSLRVEIDAVWGFGGSLRCTGVLVESVKVLPHET